jgi:L-talarate/galactarate dehydratase
MKISSYQVDVVRVPEGGVIEPSKSPWDRAAGWGDDRFLVVLRLGTDEGGYGLGYTFHYFADPLTEALRATVVALAETVLGADPRSHEAVRAAMARATAGAGPGGLATLAAAAVDIAVWDLRAKAAGMPLWQLLGGARNRMPVYVSGAIHGSLSDEVVAQRADELVARGFSGIKLFFPMPGDPSPRRVAERVALVRDRVGPDVKIICDAHESWSRAEAVDLARRMEPLELYWLEDVAAPDDLSEWARIRASVRTSIGGGESLWGAAPFRDVLERQAMDVLVLDVFRAGGITSWLKVAAMAELFDVPVTNHGSAELLGHLVAAVPNGLVIEHFPAQDALFHGLPEVRAGEMVLSDRPGLGLEFDEAFIDGHRVLPPR